MDRVDYQSLIVQDLINWYDAKELNLNPWYQRRAVWKNAQKSYLINTLLEDKPIPSKGLPLFHILRDAFGSSG